MANFYNLFVAAAGRFPDRSAVELQKQSGDGQQHSYRELRQQAESLGHWLGQQHRPGTSCAILAANGPQWVATYLGILASGCVAVPLDTAFKPEQVRKLLADSDAVLLFTDERDRHVAEQACAGTRIQVISIEDPEPFCSHPPQPPDLPLARNDEDTAVMLYTSGTTSDPKGVMLSHANLAAEASSVFAFLKVTEQDAILGVLPLFHALAQMANLLLPLTVGARVVYLESLNTRELMRALAERDITLFCCVPQFFYLIHKRIFHEVEQRGTAAQSIFRSLLAFCRGARRLGLNPGRVVFRRAHEALGKRMRYLISGGSRFDPEIARDLHALGFEILQAYGLTETSGGACCTRPNDNVLGSVGKPLPNVQLSIVGAAPDENGHSVGEIALRGGIVMKGYYKRSDATDEVLHENWLHTGDLGYLDHGGNLFITGRRKEIIVLSSGKNIYPEEIEAHYEKSPWIKEVCVLGIEGKPGEPASEKLHAIIVPDFDMLRAKKIVNAKEMIRFDVDSLSAQLPSTKRVLSYEIWQEDLPRTTTRKLKRFQIQQRMAAGKSGTSADAEFAVPPRQLTADDLRWLDQPDVADAFEAVRRASNLKKDDLHPADSLELDLGLDSMERVELLVELEQALGTDVPDAVASEVYTVREMIDAVRAGKPAVAGHGKQRVVEGWDTVLAEPPAPEDLKSLSAPRPISVPLWYGATRMLQMLARDIFHLEVCGTEKLPNEGAFILCPNHQSYIDPPIVISTLPWPVFQRMFTIGTSEIFGSGIGRRIAHSFRLFPVDPDRNLVPAMRIGAAGLRQGKALVLYPEGERSIDGSPKRFKRGAAILATHLKVPIVPVAIDGFFDVWPRSSRLPKRIAKLKIAFCDPVFPRTGTGNLEREYERVMSEVRSRVVEKWQQLHDGGRRAMQASAD
jgi:long-chain acyl-CoA synthetase